jgi:hypothetical protein
MATPSQMRQFLSNSDPVLREWAPHYGRAPAWERRSGGGAYPAGPAAGGSSLQMSKDNAEVGLGGSGAI